MLSGLPVFIDEAISYSNLHQLYFVQINDANDDWIWRWCFIRNIGF